MEKKNKEKTYCLPIVILITLIIVIGGITIYLEQEFKITKNGIEVELIEIKSLAFMSILDTDAELCKNKENYSLEPCEQWLPEEKKELWKHFDYCCIRTDKISKEELSKDWLEENCLCKDCEGTWDKMYDDYITCDIKCSKYKCGEYQVEVN